jgi:hypothetical protein
MEMHLRKLYMKAGDNSAELEGEGISLAHPLVRDLLSRIFSGIIDPADQNKLDALTKTLSDSAGQLSDSIDKGK